MASTQQFLLFCAVGVATTAVDLAVFNLLAGAPLRWRRIPANIVSVSVAMAWSFLANGLLVFHPAENAWMDRFGSFLATTAFSAFVLQNAVLYLTSNLWKDPVKFALALSRRLRLGQKLPEDAISRNICKLLAISTGLIWNFCFYKFFVYAN